MNFLCLNEQKSEASHPLWENVKTVSQTDDCRLFYCRVCVSMFSYFYRWYLSCAYASVKTKTPLDHRFLDCIINHFSHITACIVASTKRGTVARERDGSTGWDPFTVSTAREVLVIFRHSARRDLENIKNGKPIDMSSTNLEIYRILINDTSKDSVQLIDEKCLYFDAVGTVIWFWVHLSAGAVVAMNLGPRLTSGFWEFFDYVKYILSCGVCRHHYDTKVYPIINKLRKNTKDVLSGSIVIHDAVNMNKYMTREDYTAINQTPGDEYYKKYLECWTGG